MFSSCSPDSLGPGGPQGQPHSWRLGPLLPTPDRPPGSVVFSEGRAQRALVCTSQLRLNCVEPLSRCPWRFWHWHRAWSGSWVSDGQSTCLGVPASLSRPDSPFVPLCPSVPWRHSVFPAFDFAFFTSVPSCGSGLQLSWHFLDCMPHW